MLKRLLLSKLKLDYSLYPRERIDRYHVRQFVEALGAEAHFPPIVAEAKTYRVVDGFHRIEAFRQAFGDEALIDVELKKYASDADLFSDAVAANSKHGQGFSTYDKARALAKAQTLGIELKSISALLQMTIETAQEMRQERFAIYDMKPIALKRSAAHFAGQEIDEAQMIYNQRSGGQPQYFYINQVAAMLENNSVNWESKKVVNGLRKLHELLGKALGVAIVK